MRGAIERGGAEAVCVAVFTAAAAVQSTEAATQL